MLQAQPPRFFAAVVSPAAGLLAYLSSCGRLAVLRTVTLRRGHAQLRACVSGGHHDTSCGLAWWYGEAIGVLAFVWRRRLCFLDVTSTTSTLWTTCLRLFSCSCVRMLFPFSCTCLVHSWWSSDAYGEVNAVGQWKPISCGEPTFVQGSVVDNKEFVFSWNCCVRVSDGLHDVCRNGEVCAFALRSSGPRVWFPERVRSPRWMDGPMTSVEESAVTVQGTAPVAVVDNKVFVFLEFAAYEYHTGHSTTGLVSATPPSQALARPLVSLRPLFLAHWCYVKSPMT